MPDTEKNINDVIEISPKDLMLFFSRNIKLLLLITLVSAIVGIAGSYLLPKTFKAQTILLPEYKMGGNSLISMAMGINSSEGAERLVPDLYPNILLSVPFGLYILNVPVTDNKNTQYPSLKNYFERNATTSIISKIFSFGSVQKTSAKESSILLQDKEILSLSKQDENLVKSVNNLVKASIDSKSGIITIDCEMKDPVVAAILVNAGKKYLINYVEEYRTSKQVQQSSFLTQRVVEAKKRLYNAEYALQSYRDRNRNAFLNVARIEEQRLQSDYTLAQSIYADLVQRLEQVKIKVKEEKPVFKVLEPAKIPLDKNGPKRFSIGIIFAFIGGFFTFIYIVFFKEKLLQKIF